MGGQGRADDGVERAASALAYAVIGAVGMLAEPRSRTATTTGFLLLEAGLSALLHRAATRSSPRPGPVRLPTP